MNLDEFKYWTDHNFNLSLKHHICADWIIGYSTLPHPNTSVALHYSVPGHLSLDTRTLRTPT